MLKNTSVDKNKQQRKAQQETINMGHTPFSNSVLFSTYIFSKTPYSQMYYTATNRKVSGLSEDFKLKPVNVLNKIVEN